MVEVSVTVLPDGRVDRRNAARYLGLTPKTLANWHNNGYGPRSRLVGARRFYNIDELRSFALGGE